MVLGFSDYLNVNNLNQFCGQHRHIYDRDGTRVQSIESTYDNIFGVMVTRDDTDMKYYTYPDPAVGVDIYNRYSNYCVAEGAHPHFHEVVPPTQIQRIYFDIDIKINQETAEDMREFADHVIDVVKGLTCELLEDIYESKMGGSECHINQQSIAAYDPDGDHQLTPDNYLFRVFNSNSDAKISYHLMTPVYCKNQSIAKMCFNLIRDRAVDMLYSESDTHTVEFLETIIDGNVSRPWSSLRMWGSSKPTDPARVKVLDNPNICETRMEDSLICWSDTTTTPPVYIHELEGSDVATFVLGNKSTSPDDLKMISELAGKTPGLHFQDWEFRNETNGMFWFKKLRPTTCAVCSGSAPERPRHKMDNTLFFTIGPSASRPVYMHCVRKSGGKIKIGNLGTINPAEFTRAKLRDAINGPPPPTYPVTDWFEKFGSRDQITSTDDPAVDIMQFKTPLQNIKSTLIIKANMKMGKTAALIRLIRDMGTGLPANPKIVFISFRQTFTQSITPRLNESAPANLKFESYKDINTFNLWLDMHPRCIVQVDSLGRIQPSAAKVDLVILDEVESILSQFSSPLIKDLNKSYAVFEWLMSTSAKCICMDANISVRTLNMLKKWRPVASFRMYNNDNKNAADDKYYMLPTKDALLPIMIDKLRAGKRIVICTNSLAEARIYKQAIARNFQLINITDIPHNPEIVDGDPEYERAEEPLDDIKRIAIYTSETSPTIKDAHFKAVARYWSDVDILIYTPTVSAGISYEVSHFNCLFGYFSDLSCDVETARQMIGRVRDIKDKEYYIAIEGRQSSLPTDPATVTRYLLHIRNKLDRVGITKHDGEPPIEFSFDENGELRYKELNFFDLWVQNICQKNRSKNNYMAEFVGQVKGTGASVQLLEDAAKTSADMPDRAELSREASEERGRQLVVAPKLQDDTYEEIKLAVSGQSANVSITPEMMNSYVKTFMCKFYNLRPPTLDTMEDVHLAEFLERPNSMYVFRNLCDVRPLISLDGQPPPNTYDLVIQELKGAEVRRRAQCEQSKKNIGDVSVETRTVRHAEAWNLLRRIGYTHIGDASTFADSDMNDIIYSFARADPERIKILAMIFNIRAFVPVGPTVPGGVVPPNIKTKATAFIKSIIGMYGLSLIKKGRANPTWCISHNPTLTTLALQKTDTPTHDIERIYL